MIRGKGKAILMAGILSILSFMTPDASLVAEGSEVPVIYLDARGKTGTEVGEAFWASIMEEFPDMEQRADGYLRYLIDLVSLGSGYTGQVIFDYLIRPRADQMRGNIEPRYRDEVEAVASYLAFPNGGVLGDGYLSLSELWVLQLLPDIGRGTNCSGFGVFGDVSSLGSPIVGRNLDWDTNEDARSIQAITVYYYEERTLVNIGFAGLCGVITGFNSDGLFAGILDSSMEGPYPASLTNRRSYIFDLRSALETCTTVSAAADMLYNRSYAFSHNILFADNSDVRVLENPEGAVGRVRTSHSILRPDLSWGKEDQIAVVNFFALSGFLNGSYPWNFLRWNRFKTLAAFNSTGLRASVSDVGNIMLDTANSPFEIFNAATVQSMVFVPAQMKLYLYTMPVSGSHDPSPALEGVSIAISPVPTLAAFAAEFGHADCRNGTPCQCDFDGDGDVDGNDLAEMVIL